MSCSNSEVSVSEESAKDLGADGVGGVGGGGDGSGDGEAGEGGQEEGRLLGGNGTPKMKGETRRVETSKEGRKEDRRPAGSLLALHTSSLFHGNGP